MAAHAAQHGVELETFGVLIAVGATLLVAFLVGLTEQLRAADASLSTLATTGLVAGVMTQTLVIAGVALIQAEAFALELASTALVAHSHTVAYVLFAISGWPTALMTGAYGMAILRAGVPSRASAWLAFAAAVTHIGAGVALTPSGVWSLSGPVALTAPAVFILWVIALSVELLVRRHAMGRELSMARS
jgi:hypothetical protein